MKFTAAIAALFLAVPALSHQWSMQRSVDDWGQLRPGRPISEWTAPMWTHSSTPGGIEARLEVVSCWDAKLWLSRPEMKRTRKPVIEVQVDGKRVDWTGTALSNSSITWATSRGIVTTLGTAKTFEVMVPLETGPARFSFDMTGARDTIAELCPGYGL